MGAIRRRSLLPLGGQVEPEAHSRPGWAASGIAKYALQIQYVLLFSKSPQNGEGRKPCLMVEALFAESSVLCLLAPRVGLLEL